jgi:hypothetical protein
MIIRNDETHSDANWNPFALQDPEIGNLNCQNVCRGAHRADGVTNPQNPLEVGTPCNANGKYDTVSGWNAQFRKACYKQ